MGFMKKMEDLAASVTDAFKGINTSEIVEDTKRTLNSVASLQAFNGFGESEDLIQDTIDLLTPQSFKPTSQNIKPEQRAQMEHIHKKQSQSQEIVKADIYAMNVYQKYKDSIPEAADTKIQKYVGDGASFTDAVKQYQTEVGVIADGLFGKNSIAASRAFEKATTPPIVNVEEGYTVQKGDTLSKIAKKLGVPQSSLKRSKKAKYLQIGEQLSIKGYKKEEADFGGKDSEDSVMMSFIDKTTEALTGKKGVLNSDEYMGRFVKALGEGINPFGDKKWTNQDFSNKFLNKLNEVALAAGGSMKVGESMVVNPEFVSRHFGYEQMGYGNGNIQKDTGDREVDLLRKGLGNFTLTKTKEGFIVKDVYDFKEGTVDMIKGEENSLFKFGHRLGEQFLSEDEGEGIQVDIKLASKASKLVKA